MNKMLDIAWIAVDWGTSTLRAWAMTTNGEVIERRSSDKGMSGLAQQEFEPALLELIADWLVRDHTDVVACGMLGSRQGWVEAPYQTAPCKPLAPSLSNAPTLDQRISVHVIAGIKQDHPADVMRGEETQIAGFLSTNEHYDGVLCLPGTHTKWVNVVGGKVASFKTYMTGDLFACTSQHSVLRHSVSSNDWNNNAFLKSVTDVTSAPESLAGMLFSLRSESLLENLPPATARSRLSGILIGAELAAARQMFEGQKVSLIGAAGLSAIYASALKSLEQTVLQADGEEMTLRGLSVAMTNITKTA